MATVAFPATVTLVSLTCGCVGVEGGPTENASDVRRLITMMIVSTIVEKMPAGATMFVACRWSRSCAA